MAHCLIHIVVLCKNLFEWFGLQWVNAMKQSSLPYFYKHSKLKDRLPHYLFF